MGKNWVVNRMQVVQFVAVSMQWVDLAGVRRRDYSNWHLVLNCIPNTPFCNTGI